jgi:A/G-specific adenine glycosylase
MLQQTQVDRVIPKFHAFMQRLPTMHALAEVDKVSLLTLWSGLGFNARALRLQRCAQVLVAQYGWVLPKDREILRSLPGIGPYASASLLAFTYNIEAPVIDTNIRRVLLHELVIAEPTSQAEREALALACIPKGKSNDRHNALMDYGSQVATAKGTGIKPLSKQSTFSWSVRQARGQILKSLLAHGHLSQKELLSLVPHEHLERALGTLMKEGVIVVEKRKYRVKK